MKKMIEILDIVDETGKPTGRTVTREEAHKKGILHRTSHVWLVRKKAGDIELLLQKRSRNKDSHPGCFDISSAGHIPAGVDFKASAVREMQEELGITITEDRLVYLGRRHFEYTANFHGSLFHDNQISNVYMVWMDVDETKLVLQEEELEGVQWMELRECMEMVRDNSEPNCIAMEELFMIEQKTKEAEDECEGRQ